MTGFHPYVDPTAIIGLNCDIATDAVVGAGVTIRDNVMIGPGSVIIGPCLIGAGCIMASGCILDASADAGEGLLFIGAGVSILAGAIISAKVSIGSGARVLAGTVVQRTVPPHAIVGGNPAQIMGYTLSTGRLGLESSTINAPWVESVVESQVRGVLLHRLPRILDLRGNLSVGEFGRSVPFAPKRYFVVFGVPNSEIRGEHAHRTCEQFLCCVRGHCSIVVDDGENREEYMLDDPAIGLYLPPMTWGIQYKYSMDAVLLAFASEFYDPEEYIRDYDEFLSLAR